MNLDEIKIRLTDNNITMNDFQKALGHFRFRFDEKGNKILCPADVRNTISRILNDKESKIEERCNAVLLNAV